MELSRALQEFHKQQLRSGLVQRSGRLCVLGLDVGDKNVGVAVSDGSRSLAYPLCVLSRRSQYSLKLSAGRPDGVSTGGGGAPSLLTSLNHIVDSFNIGGVVVGWPIEMTGREGKQVQKTKSFVEELIKAEGSRFRGMIVAGWDERLSSRLALHRFTEMSALATYRKTGAKLGGLKILREDARASFGSARITYGIDSLAAAGILQDFLERHQDIMKV